MSLTETVNLKMRIPKLGTLREVCMMTRLTKNVLGEAGATEDDLVDVSGVRVKPVSHLMSPFVGNDFKVCL